MMSTPMAPEGEEPASMQAHPRIGPLLPDRLDVDQAELYASIVGGPRASGPQHFSLTEPDGSLAGPFNALLLSPGIGSAVQGLGAAVRYRSHLSDRVRELAILVVAAQWKSAFEAAAHEAVGRAVGLSDLEMKTVAAGEVPVLGDPYESACARLVRAMAEGDVGDELWEDTSALVSPDVIFELVSLVGYYSGLALQMRVFRVEG